MTTGRINQVDISLQELKLIQQFQTSTHPTRSHIRREPTSVTARNAPLLSSVDQLHLLTEQQPSETSSRHSSVATRATKTPPDDDPSRVFSPANTTIKHIDLVSSTKLTEFSRTQLHFPPTKKTETHHDCKQPDAPHLQHKSKPQRESFVVLIRLLAHDLRRRKKPRATRAF